MSKQELIVTVSPHSSSSDAPLGLWEKKGDLADFDNSDPVLTSKISLINDAIDEIGFTPYHLKLFFLNGLGYSVDSQLTMIQSSVAHYVRSQYNITYPADSHAFYAGLLVGALFWGFGADMIGRKLAFNTSLIFSSLFAILAGTMGNYGTYCLFLALSAAASGGNLVLDCTVFLEFLPSKHQWLVTFMASWWALGQTLAVLTAWLFFSIPRFRCDDTDIGCTPADNMGWRYVWFLNGGFVLILSILRLTVIDLKETPKFLVANNRDKEAYSVLREIAIKYNRPLTLRLEDLEELGDTGNKNYLLNPTFGELFRTIKKHIFILFSSRKLARSTSLVYLSWLLLGISYPLYSNFLPQLLAARGAQTAATSFSGVYKDSVIANAASVGGAVIAGIILFFFPIVGRRGVMAIGAITTMAFFFGYTAVKTRAQNVALSSCVYIAINMYYSCLYAYTPEVMPSSARATGNAIAVSLTRLMACFVPLIAYFADTSSSIPVWICGAAVGLIAILCVFLPFEPSLQRVA